MLYRNCRQIVLQFSNARIIYWSTILIHW
jgi:hypothetical protein